MQTKEPQPRRGLESIESQFVIAGTSVNFMNHARVGRRRDLPFVFAQPQAEFGVFPVQKENFVEQADVFERFTGNQHAGSVERVKPVIGTRTRAVTAKTNPQVDMRATPGLDSRLIVGVVADRSDRADSFVSCGLGNE